MPSWRASRPSSSEVSRSTASAAESPSRRSAKPFGPYRGFAYACVAIAPTSGSAHGTTEPTARNFDCTATPHCFASRSQATIEYVATTGSAIGQLGQVEREQVAALLGHEHRRHLGPSERCPHVLRRRSAHHDGTARLERRGYPLQVVDIVEDERLVGRHRGISLHRELRHAPAASAPPALPHSVTESPGSSSSTWTSGASSRSCAGVPTSGGKVP